MVYKMKAKAEQCYSDTIQGVLAYNRSFVKQSRYVPFKTDKFPAKQLAVISCMDTRLTELLPAALGLKNGDAKIIKVAGAEVSEPFGAVMRSILVAVCELKVKDIMIIAHTNCGAQHMSGAAMTQSMKQLGVPSQNIDALREQGIDINAWLAGFEDLEASVRKSVAMVRSCPVLPPQVHVMGFVINTTTGELSPVE